MIFDENHYFKLTAKHIVEFRSKKERGDFLKLDKSFKEFLNVRLPFASEVFLPLIQVSKNFLAEAVSKYVDALRRRQR